MPENHGCDPWPCEDCLLDVLVCQWCRETYLLRDAPNLDFGPFGPVYLVAQCFPCHVKQLERWAEGDVPPHV